MKKLLTLLMATILMLAMATTALAATDFSVTTNDGTYTETDTTLTITKAGTYTITTDAETTDNIKIAVNDDTAVVILNLNGVDIETTSSSAIEVSSALKSLTINVTAESSIEGKYSGIKMSYSQSDSAALAISGNANFDITGTGNQSSDIHGISTMSDVILDNSATINITAGEAVTGQYSYYSVGMGGTGSSTGVVTIEQGFVNFTSGAAAHSQAINAGTVTIEKDAIVTATAGTSGDGTGVSATYGTYDNTYHYDALVVYGKLTASGSNIGVHAAGFTVEEGGTLIANSLADDSGYSKSYIKGGTVTVTSTDDYQNAINCNGSLEISGGTVTATATTTTTVGAYVASKGISADTLTISGGDVTASSANSNAIEAGTLTISGGEVKATATAGNAIQSNPMAH